MNNDDSTAPAAPIGNSLVSRLLLVGFMGAVVLAECMFAYFWLPSADEVAARTEQMAQEMTPEEEDEEQAAEETQEKEVDLGQFTVTNHKGSGVATLRTEFRLFGTISTTEEPEFSELFARNTNRFRDCVIVEIRDSETDDLTNAKLGLIKRRILEKSNALFGKPVLRSVGFADYSFVEI